MKVFAAVLIGLALAIPAYNAAGNYLQSNTQGQTNLPVVTADAQLYFSLAALVVFLIVIFL